MTIWWPGSRRTRGDRGPTRFRSSTLPAKGVRTLHALERHGRYQSRIPPSAAAWGDSLGFAYGAYMFDRFTTFDLATRDLSLAYLMSTSSPYQVQVMRTVEPTIESRRSRGDELKPPDPLRNHD